MHYSLGKRAQYVFHCSLSFASKRCNNRNLLCVSPVQFLFIQFMGLLTSYYKDLFLLSPIIPMSQCHHFHLVLLEGGEGFLLVQSVDSLKSIMFLVSIYLSSRLLLLQSLDCKQLCHCRRKIQNENNNNN